MAAEQVDGVDKDGQGLELVVASMVGADPAVDADAHREQLASIAELQERLRTEGVSVDLLSAQHTEVWSATIADVGALYQLARLTRRVELDREVDDVLDDGPVLPEDLDPLVTDVWDELVATRFPQLVNLQGVNTYYLPVDFDGPVYLDFTDPDGEEDTATFGSSGRLLAELDALEPLLRDAGVPEPGPAHDVLTVLREAARQSVANELPVIVW
jgi:hypothetical protein